MSLNLGMSEATIGAHEGTEYAMVGEYTTDEDG